MTKIVLLLSLIQPSFAGVIESKIDNHRVLIRSMSVQLKEGDQVLAYKKLCSGAKVKLCKNAVAGEGTITKVRDNQHYEVQFEDHLELSDIISVEKK